MIALHCTVTVPRDYDLKRVRDRIERDAPALDEAPGLLFFAHGVREAGASGIAVHQYVLASVWTNTSRMGDYLWGDGNFERVRAQYGAARVSLWPVAGLQLDRTTLDRASMVEISEGPPALDGALSTLAASAKDAASKAIKSRDVHAAVRGLDAASGRTWQCDLRTGLSRDPDGELFDLVHLSAPTPPA